MPRIQDSLANMHDFCKDHFPGEKNAIKKFAVLGDGPDDRGNCFNWNTDHPPYNLDSYIHCENCGKLLDETDDEPRPGEGGYPQYELHASDIHVTNSKEYSYLMAYRIANPSKKFEVIARR